MKKIDALLKKVELFERLAVYGDRKSFLQALAQNLPDIVVPNDPSAPPGQGGVHRVNVNNPAAPAAPTSRPAPLPRVVVPNAGPPGSGGHWVDPNEVSDEAPPVDRDPNLMLQKQLNPSAIREQDKPAPVAKAPVFNPKVKQLQSFLNNLTRSGKMALLPLREDGLWGRDTASALQEWATQSGHKGNLNSAFTAALGQAGSGTAKA